MNQTNLKELGKELKKLTTIANSDPNKATDPQKRRMLLGNITQAKEKLQGLQLEYRKLIMQRAIFILVTGPKSKEFSSIAEKSYSCFSVNADDLYKDLIKDVPESLYVDKVPSNQLLEAISNNLEDKARLLSIVSYPAIFMEAKYRKTLKNKEDLLNLTKLVVNDKVGGELVGLYSVDKIAPKLMKSKNGGVKVPIVIRIDDSDIVEEVAKGIKRSISHKTFIISTDESPSDKLKSIMFDNVSDVTEENVEKSLMILNKTLK